MRLILGWLAIAHQRWARMDLARSDLLMARADEAQRCATAHIERSYALAAAAGYRRP